MILIIFLITIIIIIFLITKIRDEIFIIIFQIKKNIFSDTKKVEIILIIVFANTKIEDWNKMIIRLLKWICCFKIVIKKFVYRNNDMNNMVIFSWERLINKNNWIDNK